LLNGVTFLLQFISYNNPFHKPFAKLLFMKNKNDQSTSYEELNNQQQFPIKKDDNVEYTERLHRHFSETMSMRTSFPVKATPELQNIHNGIKSLFKLDITETIAREIFWLTHSIAHNDLYYGYSKYNYAGQNLISDNISQLGDIPEIIEARRKKEGAVSRVFLQYRLLKAFETVSQIEKEYNILSEEFVDFYRIEHEESMADIIGFEDKRERINLLYPDIMELQIKVKTNFRAVTARLNKTPQASSVLPETEVYSIKITDPSANLWLLSAIREKYSENLYQENKDTDSYVPEIKKPYHQLVNSLYKYIDEVFPGKSRSRTKQLANWILAETGILINESLFDRLSERLKNFPYDGKYMDYLKAVDPNRNR
jgi:hypothetical protein